mmetsp:Transcript_6895/g.14367  ORF Transcript_6895/g.14367 Transcript_6895/m.14367 type:complete len:256 (+) Transcript_6895:44-811(+)|eukprot:CAMPEP_0113400052 /NCGR_PEP_ID=MMETSP0013_2-20120614/15902_1 /TAXON_ID=2843 ORGANISM="Skeletonema costatum, Strain 1716" /NCGR_SAMPLE_ID=MMETSP0013_2 /ASSEMBLY_ACC=CAM_ASM_000158 /LENGTH=255 /DNA_ID=CAMNT_0000285065 /DNA_START=25 /DNA_END=792 /DNA_ORIENTATION=+ /assembly_acc=CAM_ASM_000158
MKLAILATLAASAAAFAPAQVGKVATTSQLSETKADLEALATKANPTIKYYDPLNLADQDFWGKGNEATIAWLRQSEIKHGRIAMFAFVGYIVQSNFVFPWAQTLDGSPHPSPDLVPEAQWDAVPEAAKWQIFAVISMLELWDECGGGGAMPHYTKGRQAGKYPPFTLFRDNVHFVLDLYDPFGFNKNMSEETKERRLTAELNNGRLAQLGIFGFLCADKIPGSVPALNDIAISYAGNPMIPFEGQFSYHIWYDL